MWSIMRSARCFLSVSRCPSVSERSPSPSPIAKLGGTSLLVGESEGFFGRGLGVAWIWLCVDLSRSSV